MNVSNLTLNYEDREEPVLRDISFSVNEKETVLLLGASGSGKSTLTHCLTGLYPRELEGSMEGRVIFHDKPVADALPGAVSRSIGIVFQDPETQFCMLTVEDEVAFGLENLQVDPEVMEESIDAVLRDVGLQEKKKAKITYLSGGEKQKLALACILVMNPTMIILDEPTANLDPVATEAFVSLLEKLKRTTEVSFFVIEHDLDPWVSMTDRVLMLGRDGRIFYDGPLRGGLQQYAGDLKSEGISMPRVSELALQAGVVGSSIPLTMEELKGRFPIISGDRHKGEGKESLLGAEHVSWKSVLRDVDVSVEKGSFTAVVGPNGSGKTTLCRLLAGITAPSSGEIWHPFGKKERFSHVGYVFQNPEHQFLTDSVWEEVAYSSADHAQVKRMLEWCGLTNHADLHPFRLSQGQKRRLSVATMLVNDQDVLFLDEPTFGQDAASTEHLMKLLEDKHRSGTTIVMITHDMELVDVYATRVIAMKEGQIAYSGDPEELWEEDVEALHLKRPLRVQLESEAYVPQ
ncbi:energy-coupling factor transport system ATP-binding protein [Salimicrobium halophilum]|uniref:Energy-coupling factor transport system ATP-binding protein n=2 Tax=Salimicrobium halophilum TaxID=86666 RepID=A0A1G8T3S3_9BACI|nr:energy-coupling factor transport system ATP-binding protein [Salimicrobium halophilum]